MLTCLTWLVCVTAVAGDQLHPNDAEGPVSKSHPDGIAIGGYDTVRYHDPAVIENHAAERGSRQWVYEWRGAEWRFVSEQSYEQFKADPEKHQPAFGGFCSNALRLGEGLIRTDGSVWEIFDDRLHLFFAPRGRDRWLDGNYGQYLAEAEAAWLEITSGN